MLADTVIKERPDIEAKRDEIVVSMDNDQRTLKGIENNILKLLNESELEQILTKRQQVLKWHMTALVQSFGMSPNQLL